MRLEKNWECFAKNRIENVSRETYVRPLRIKRVFNLLSVLCGHTFLPFIPLSPVFSFSARRKVARKVLSITHLGRMRPKQAQGRAWLPGTYVPSAEWTEKWTKKQTADLTAEQRHLALRLPAKTRRSNYLYMPVRCRKIGMTKVPWKSAAANKNVR